MLNIEVLRKKLNFSKKTFQNKNPFNQHYKIIAAQNQADFHQF